MKLINILANLEASKVSSPWKVKKLYILAGHLYSQSSNEGAAARSWRAALAQHWLCAGAAGARAAGAGGRPDAALRAAARLASVAHEAPAPQHIQIWCTVAAIALQARAYDLCSKALIKLEELEPETFENIAIEIFTRCKPKDAKGNKVECPHCFVSMPDWAASCPGCDHQFPGCVVSGRVLLASHSIWTCPKCEAKAQHHELVLRHSCPLCHSQL